MYSNDNLELRDYRNSNSDIKGRVEKKNRSLGNGCLFISKMVKQESLDLDRRYFEEKNKQRA